MVCFDVLINLSETEIKMKHRILALCCMSLVACGNAAAQQLGQRGYQPLVYPMAGATPFYAQPLERQYYQPYSPPPQYYQPQQYYPPQQFYPQYTVPQYSTPPYSQQYTVPQYYQPQQYYPQYQPRYYPRR
jgi:hypothetical protein